MFQNIGMKASIVATDRTVAKTVRAGAGQRTGEALTCSSNLETELLEERK